MPLRDHFRPPWDDVHSWDELHGMWPGVCVQKLIEDLPEPYFSAPGVHLGTLYEVSIGTYRRPSAEANDFDVAKGGVAVATGAPPQRMRCEDRRRMMDNRYHPLVIGQVLPTLPIWLRENWAISLDLESSYEPTCRTLRIR